jgi:purine-cytosine permease-like protein
VGTEIVGREREQPESDRVWSIGTNGINAIPDPDRHGKPVELFWIWFAANISIHGTVISFVHVGLVSLAGKRGGAPTLTLSRAPFGVVGNALPTVVRYLALVGWKTILVALASLAAWGAIFLIDLALYRWREGCDERALYDSSARYGAVPAGLIAWIVAVVVGLGLVTSTATVFSWTG